MSPKTKHFARDNSCATPQVTSRPLPSYGKEIVEELPKGTIEFKPVAPTLIKDAIHKKPQGLRRCHHCLPLSAAALHEGRGLALTFIPGAAQPGWMKWGCHHPTGQHLQLSSRLGRAMQQALMPFGPEPLPYSNPSCFSFHSLIYFFQVQTSTGTQSSPSAPSEPAATYIPLAQETKGEICISTEKRLSTNFLNLLSAHLGHLS